MTTIDNQEGWQLQSLQIEYQTWGEYAGKHTARITFQNKSKDAFTFNLSPEECQAYLHLIKDKLVANAGVLGQKLLSSLNLLPAPPDPLAMAEEISHEIVK